MAPQISWLSGIRSITWQVQYLADDAAWCEHMAAGGVYTDPHIVDRLAQRFDNLRAESYRASESLAMIDRMAELWSAGVSPLSQTATAASA